MGDVPIVERRASARQSRPAGARGVERRSGNLARRTYAIVLAGGRGSRLKELTDWRCKPAVPFGGKYRIIDFTLSNCVNSGVRRIGVATQYKSFSLIRHLQRGWSFLDGRIGEHVDILPAQQQIEEAWYRGTADAVFQNLNVLRQDGCDYVLVLSGDHVYKMDYGRLLQAHALCGADATVVSIDVPLAEAKGFGVVAVDEAGRIVGFEEKPASPRPMAEAPDRALASMGVYVFNARFLYEQLIRDADDPHSSHDFGKDILPYIIGRYRVHAHRFADSCVGMPYGQPYWRDVGTLDAYWEANLDLARITPDLNLYDRDWPVWTYQEQLPPAKFVFDGEHRRGMAVDSMVSGGCVVSGATVRRSVLFSNVRVEDGALLEDCVVLPDVVVGPGVQLQRAIVDRHCRLDAGMDPRQFRSTDKGITLITPEMLGQRVHQLR
ncbi:MAG TPA: glucose-1-phosphate adenylyltransferase [Burkholderiales bacterium]|jgi:glucose-1-phosphate adenylyltransferase|nr:glucose-1-phosphate adenylyltransferase [Burkholderiales bacterium]